MRKTGLLLALFATALTACGGGDSADDAFQPPPAPNDPVSTVSSLTVTTDTPTLASDGGTPANIKAYARDANNRLMSAVPVTFSASSGAVAVTSATTDQTGAATATLTPLTPDSRVITVTATAGTKTASVNVAVTGSSLDIQGPDALITSTPGTFTVTLVNSANKPLANQGVAISSNPASTLNPAALTTDANGRATFTMTPTSGASVTLTARAAGETKTKAVAVSADSFAFTTPAADTQVLLNTPVTFTVGWQSSGAAVANGRAVNFSTTRGTLSASSAVTAAGLASTTLQSATAGEAIVTAVNASGGATQRRVVFVASQAASVSLQAAPQTVAINQSSTLTATVRDAANNLVANKPVVFSLSDSTGGSINVGTAVTDAQGRARTVYTASSTTSAANGVRVTVTVQDAPTVTANATLTVAGSPLFLAFGTGNSIEEINNDTQYRVNYVVQVTDSNGVGVKDATVVLSALHWNYMKGGYAWDATDSVWRRTSTAVCMNEDRFTGLPQYDFNGVLDPGENQNGTDLQGRLTLESGNVAAVSPGTGVTDANGFLNFTLTYPQNFGGWIELVLRAATAVQGTEYSRTSLPFTLQVASADLTNRDVTPPGVTSPFGISSACSSFN